MTSILVFLIIISSRILTSFSLLLLAIVFLIVSLNAVILVYLCVSFLFISIVILLLPCFISIIFLLLSVPPFYILSLFQLSLSICLLILVFGLLGLSLLELVRLSS